MVQDGDAAPDLDAVVVSAVLEEVHVPLGTDLAVHWGLPGFVAHVCANHHAPSPEGAPVNDALHLVRIASGLYESRTNPCYRRSLPAELFSSALSLGLAKEPLEALASELKKLGSAG